MKRMCLSSDCSLAKRQRGDDESATESGDEDMFGDAEPYDDFDDDELEWIYEPDGQYWWTITGLFWNHDDGYGWWSGTWASFTWTTRQQWYQTYFAELDRAALDE